MKQFLRYQVSGMTFIFWIILFHYGSYTTNLPEILELLTKSFSNKMLLKSLIGLFSAMPIGVMIHQVSVMCKNWCVSYLIREFNDYPRRDMILSKSDVKDYIIERISNLNSYYYVRVDNGIMAPLFAYIIVEYVMSESINGIWIFASIIIGLVLTSYLIRIKKEMNEYYRILRSGSVNK